MHSYEWFVSQHEGQVDVRHSVTDVDRSEDGSLCSVVREISGPEMASKSSDSRTRVHYNAPALLRHVFSNRVQEAAVVNSLITCDELLLSGLLNFSEVLPVG